MGVDFDVGEPICVQAGEQLPNIDELQAWSRPRPEGEENKETHKIHIRPEHPSGNILPFVLL